MFDQPQKREAMGDQPQKHEVIYFLPGQIVFLVRGGADDASGKELLAWADALAKKRWESIGIFQREVLAFKPPSQENQDIKRSQMPRTTQKPSNRTASSARSNFDPGNNRPEVKSPDPFALILADVQGVKRQADLLDLILFLDRNRRKAPGGILQAVSPNWLASISRDSQPGGTGGPGARPTPYQGKAKTNEYRFEPAATDVGLREVFNMAQAQAGENVVVAILDTAPLEDLDGIYDQWVTQRSGQNDEHSLIQSLLDPKRRRLTVHLDPNVDVPSLSIEPNGYLQADGHDYEMTDHGMFVAGIIHSLAPQAELHLYQVLNRYGVGDMLSIARGLQQVQDQFSKNQLVVNLSLTLNMPLDDEHINNLGPKILDQRRSRCAHFTQKIIDFLCRLMFGPSWFDRQAWATEWICDLIYTLNSRVIAAAGNDYDRTQQQRRPQARYPAAFTRVLGVGALRKIKPFPAAAASPEPASYSNLADRPPRKGIATLGGEAGEGQGVLGIYLGKFPPSGNRDMAIESTNGWGWWAGTSFATPIISGMTAAVLSSMPPATTQEAIETLYSAQPIFTESGEEVLFVIQQTA
jgi:hypothetical protein